MKSVSLLRNLWMVALLGTAGGLYSVSIESKEVVSQKMAAPLKNIEHLMKQGKIAQANAALKEVQTIPNPSAYEKNIIEHLRIALAIKQNNLDAAFTGYDELINSTRTSASEKIQIRMAQASLAYRARQYVKAIEYIKQYFLVGGTNTHMKTLLIQSYFLNNNYKEAMTAQQKQIDEEIKNGQVPAESQWQIMANCQEKLGDQDGLRHSYTQLAMHYPKAEYWGHIMAALSSSRDLSPSVKLEILNLRFNMNLMRTSEEYMEMAEVAMQANMPHFALKILAAGYDKGVLGTDHNSTRVMRFRKFIQDKINENKSALPAKLEAFEKAPNGDDMLMLGYDQVMDGKGQSGLLLMKEALKKTLKDSNEALLHYAMAQLQVNKKNQSIQNLKSIQAQGVIKEIADLWLIKLQTKS